MTVLESQTSSQNPLTKTRGQQFHYTPLTPGLSIRESMMAYEKTYAELARLKKGMRVLDLGCGIGGPARTIASTVGCTIVGITNNAWHVERGTALTKKAGLDHLVTLVQGDFLVSLPPHHHPESVDTNKTRERERLTHTTQHKTETALPRRVLRRGLLGRVAVLRARPGRGVPRDQARAQARRAVYVPRLCHDGEV